MFRFVLSRFMFMFVVVMACACTSTRPASGATTMGTPTDPFATARSVVDFASIVMPLVRGAVESLATTDEARADVRQAIDVVTGVALPGLRAGLSGYQGRADQCAVYRASGAFADALVTVGRKLGDVGYQIPPEVLGLLQSSGGLLDELAPKDPSSVAGEDSKGVEKGSADEASPDASGSDTQAENGAAASSAAATQPEATAKPADSGMKIKSRDELLKELLEE